MGATSLQAPVKTTSQQPGGFTLSTTGTITINGQATLDPGLTWANAGVVNLGGNLVLATAAGAASFDNLAAGTLNLSGLVSNYSTFDPATESQFVISGTLVNAGLLTVSGVHNTYIQASLLQTGTILLKSDTLALTAGGSIGGAVKGVGTLELDGGVFTLDAPAVASTAAIVLAGGTIAVGGGHTVGSVNVLYGEIDGPGTFSTSGATVASLSQVAVGGGLTWNNAGFVDATGFVALNDAAGAANFVNLAGGTLSLRGVTFAGGNAAKLGRVTNAGLVTLVPGLSSEVGNVLNDTGTIALSANTLLLDVGGTLANRVVGHGTLAFGGGVEVVGAVSLAAGVTVQARGGVVVDNGFIRVGPGAGSVAFTNAAGAKFAFATDAAGIDGPSTFANYGLLAKTGGAGVSHDNAATVNAGTVEAARGTLDFAAAITGRGVLDIDAGATLETHGVGSEQGVVFNGPGTLRLDVTAAPARAIAGLASGCRVRLGPRGRRQRRDPRQHADRHADGRCRAVVPVFGVAGWAAPPGGERRPRWHAGHAHQPVGDRARPDTGALHRANSCRGVHGRSLDAGADHRTAAIGPPLRPGSPPRSATPPRPRQNLTGRARRAKRPAPAATRRQRSRTRRCRAACP